MTMLEHYAGARLIVACYTATALFFLADFLFACNVRVSFLLISQGSVKRAP
jgi:hypothetical protein